MESLLASIVTVLGLLAVLFVLLGIAGLFLRFICYPVVYVIAIPTYAALIIIESLVKLKNNNSSITNFLEIKLPKTFWKKLVMNGLASSTTCMGFLIGCILFNRDAINNPNQLIENLELLLLPNQDHNFPILIILFWISLMSVYLISFFQQDEETYPLNKLEKLILPKWFTKIIK